MTTYYIDSRATGANDGDPGGVTGPDANGIYQDAWQTLTAAYNGLDLNATDTVIFVDGSGPYYITTPLLGLKNNKTIEGNGCIIDGSIDLNDSAYKWTRSSANSAEWYLEAAAGGDPSLVQVSCGTINGRFQEDGSEEPQYSLGTPGSLSDRHLGWGDNDSLGFNTVYYRWDATDPEQAEVRVSQVNYIWDSNFLNSTINDLVMQYANDGIIRIRASSSSHELNRCVFKFAGKSQGVGVQNPNNVTLNNCITWFTAHRGYVAIDNDAGNITINNCVDVNSHLFAWVVSTYVATLTIRNCIAYNEPAGIIDTNGALMTFVEDHNLWYPSMYSETSLEYPDGADNVWTTTAATDFPASANTDIDTFSALVAAGAVDPLFKNIDLDDYDASSLHLQAASQAVASGTKWWSGENPIDMNGEPMADIQPSMGAYQSLDAPFHPMQLD